MSDLEDAWIARTERETDRHVPLEARARVRWPVPPEPVPPRCVPGDVDVRRDAYGWRIVWCWGCSREVAASKDEDEAQAAKAAHVAAVRS